jgi:hypothetical protein
MTKISSLDSGYTLGSLSLFPQAYDDKVDLYIVKNNSQTSLQHALAFNGQRIIVQDASGFPNVGILRIGTNPGEFGPYELVYYAQRTDTIFSGLQRGFASSMKNAWSAGMPVTSGVMAEHNNALRDAIHQIETDLGVETTPAKGSLNYILKQLEETWLAPRCLFRVAPSPIGPAPLTVKFQNFTLAHAVRYLWDFGDGTSSTEKNPLHTYKQEGSYTVTLNVITELGATGVATKSDYIVVDNTIITPFFYAIADESTPGPLISIETAAKLGKSASVVDFVDQTIGNVLSRYWVWGDGTSLQVADPNQHAASYSYQSPGKYNPSLLLVFSSTTTVHGYLQNELVVI